MATDYNFLLDTHLSPDEVIGLLKEWLAFEPCRPSRTAAAFTDGLICQAHTASDVNQCLMREHFTIVPTVSLSIRVVQSETFPGHANKAGTDAALRVCMLLLNQLTCDLVMQTNGEITDLVRRNGKVFVDTREQWWKERWTAEFEGTGIPFSEVPLPIT